MPDFTIDSALTYLKEKVQEFFRKGKDLQAALIAAGRAKTTAQQKGRGDLVQEAADLQTKFRKLLTDHLAWERRLHDFASYFGLDNKLGAVPALLLAVAIPSAVFLFNHLQDVYTTERLLRAVEQKVLTAEQAAGLKPTGIMEGLATVGEKFTTPFLGLAILGGVLWFGFLRRS